MAAPQFQLLDGMDQERETQVKLRYLQEHGLSGAKVPITGQSGADGSYIPPSKEEQAAMAEIKKEGNVSGWSSFWGGDQDALNNRFIEQYNKDHKTHLNAGNTEQVQQAMNDVYNKMIEKDADVRKGAMDVLFREPQTSSTAREQAMLRFIQDNPGAAGDTLGGDKVAVTGKSSKETDAAMDLLKSQEGVGMFGGGSALKNRFIEAYNIKNGTHLTTDGDQVDKAQREAFNEYMASADAPGIRRSSTVAAEAASRKSEPQNPDGIAKPTDDEIAAINRANKAGGETSYSDADLKKLTDTQKTAMVARFQTEVNGSDDFKADLKGTPLRTDGTVDDRTRDMIGQADDKYKTQLAEARAHAADSSAAVAATGGGDKETPPHVTSGTKAGIKEHSHRVGLAQTMLAEKGFLENFKKYGVDDKNGSLTGDDLIAYKTQYNAAHKGGPQLAVNGDLDADTFKALSADYLAMAAARGEKITNQAELEASLQTRKAALNQQYGRGETPDETRVASTSTEPAPEAATRSGKVDMKTIDAAETSKLADLAVAGTDLQAIQEAAQMLKKVRIAENGGDVTFTQADINTIKGDVTAYNQKQARSGGGVPQRNS
jgi:hypothetical protein